MRWARATGLLGTLACTSAVLIASAPPQPPEARSGEARQQTATGGGVFRPQGLNSGARLGISVRDLDEDLEARHKMSGPSGALVTDVSVPSPAERAGLEKNDVIVEFDGERVRSVRHLQRLVSETPPGRTVKLGVLREGHRAELHATLEKGGAEELVSGEPAGVRWLMPLEDARAAAPHEPFVQDLADDPRLGAVVQGLGPQLCDYFGVREGLLVVRVNRDSPAAQAGLKAGDVITTVNGETVGDLRTLVLQLRSQPDAAMVSLGITRDHRSLTIQVRLATSRSRRPA